MICIYFTIATCYQICRYKIVCPPSEAVTTCLLPFFFILAQCEKLVRSNFIHHCSRKPSLEFVCYFIVPNLSAHVTQRSCFLLLDTHWKKWCTPSGNNPSNTSYLLSLIYLLKFCFSLEMRINWLSPQLQCFQTHRMSVWLISWGLSQNFFSEIDLYPYTEGRVEGKQRNGGDPK